jgi:hypothetical protein
LNSIEMIVNGQPVRPGSCWAHFAREVPNDADKYELVVLESDLGKIPGKHVSLAESLSSAKQSDHLMNSILRLDRDETVKTIKWVVVSVDVARIDGVQLLIQGRCRPFVEDYSQS